MKKSLFIFAAAALALTACTSEDDVVQSTAQKQASADAVLFDTYLPEVAKVTRAGNPGGGVMTTDKLKTAGEGFGVFAFHHANTDYAAGAAIPNFMFNEHVTWSSGWGYSPLKYWPNETQQDSQTGPATSTDSPTNRLDRISFFAYAPYVTLPDKVASGMALTYPSTGKISSYENTSSPETDGILRISAEDYSGDPKIEWGISGNLDNNVDLLWGVAPAGMSYQSVNPDIHVNPTFGLPLTDMVKPDKDQRIKFLFQHALSRIGLSVVSAIDQIAAGDDGMVFNNGETRVLIEEVRVWGDFGISGVLNLNNTTANVANWEETSVNRTASTVTSPLFRFDNGTAESPLVANGYIAPDLRYDGTTITGIGNGTKTFTDLKTGVLRSEETLLAGGADPSKVATDVTYSFNKKLYKLVGTDYVRATTTATAAADVFTKDASGNYRQFAQDTDPAITLNGETEYFTLEATAKTVATPSTELVPGQPYYTLTGDIDANTALYTQFTANGSESDGTYYEVVETPVAGNDYSGTCYTDLMPRYFMVIPSAVSPATPTNISVKIKYHVVTNDPKLNAKVSDVTNEITKEIPLQLKSGKSYNLKLILGLTSVKLDATVADWQVADDAEIWLPRNNE
jgi:hypothetical protein